MRKIDVAGKRGMGDLISGISHILNLIKEDTHIVFHYPPGFDYETTITIIMEEYLPNIHYKITFEVVNYGYNVKPEGLKKIYGEENYNKTWFITSCYHEKYLKFKTQWKGNMDGPIVLMTNNEGCGPGYPYPKKWFNTGVDTYLKSLIDEKNFCHIGRPKTIKESIEILSNCSKAIGVDGGWVHACNAMSVPVILVRNEFKPGFFNNMYAKHPSIKIIETEEMFQYL